MAITSNTSLVPVGYLNGHPIGPCVKSGFCCIKVPCLYGKWNENKTACVHLEPPNEIGQRDCGIYEHLTTVLTKEEYSQYPAFGGGCGASLYNELRTEVIRKIKEGGL